MSKAMKTVNIKGKSYVEVNERIKYFREHFTLYSMLTEIIEISDTRVVLKAKIINDQGVEVANGLAYEEKSSSFINKTSYIENCETSAWGRALANFGIGVDASVASADEVINAINNQGNVVNKQQSQPAVNKQQSAIQDHTTANDTMSEEDHKKVALKNVKSAGKVLGFNGISDFQKFVVENIEIFKSNKPEEVDMKKLCLKTLTEIHEKMQELIKGEK